MKRTNFLGENDEFGKLESGSGERAGAGLSIKMNCMECDFYL